MRVICDQEALFSKTIEMAFIFTAHSPTHGIKIQFYTNFIKFLCPVHSSHNVLHGPCLVANLFILAEGEYKKPLSPFHWYKLFVHIMWSPSVLPAKPIKSFIGVVILLLPPTSQSSGNKTKNDGGGSWTSL